MDNIEFVVEENSRIRSFFFFFWSFLASLSAKTKRRKRLSKMILMDSVCIFHRCDINLQKKILEEWKLLGCFNSEEIGWSSLSDAGRPSLCPTQSVAPLIGTPWLSETSSPVSECDGVIMILLLLLIRFG